MFLRLASAVRSLLTRRRAEGELDEELRFHVEMETRANLERGIAPSEARRAALGSLGGMDQTREAVRDQRAIWTDSVVRDLGHALRQARLRPGTAALSIVTTALTVGLATAVYSVASAVLLRPIPYPRPDRLVTIWRTLDGVDFAPLPAPDLIDIRTSARTVASAAGFERDAFSLLLPGGTEWADVFRVTPDYFDTLGVRPALGRTFGPDSELPGHDRVVVLSEAFWRRAFGADPRVVGRLVPVKGEGTGAAPPTQYEVIGVAGSDLELFYPTRLRADVYVPRTSTAADLTDQARSTPSLIAVARLKPGPTAADAASEIRAMLERAGRVHPGLPTARAGVRVAPLQEELVGRTRPVFLLLASAALVLLAIGSINVTNLLLAAGMRRAPEMATRLALGCSRVRLFRQLLTEHLVLALAGGGLGFALACAITPLLRTLAPATIPRVESIAVDPAALAFAVLTTVVAACASGIVPAAIMTRPRIAWYRHLPSPTTTGRASRLRNMLVVGQTALMLALLGSAGLVVHSVWRLDRLEKGFDASHVAVGNLNLPERLATPDARAALQREILAGVRALPGVEQASIGSELPFTWGLLSRASQPARDVPINAVVAEVDAEYLPLLRIPLRAGRLLTAADTGNRHVVVVNEALARRLAPGPPLGQQVRIDDELRQVVGVVGDVTEVGAIAAHVIRRPGLARLTLPSAYVPPGTLDPLGAILLVRTRMTPAATFDAIRHRMRTVDPEVTLRRIGTLEERVLSAGADTRFSGTIIAIFALAALVLSAIGLYGVLAHSVGERTREIGIRLALGAAPARIGRTVAGRALALVGAGGVLGAGIWWTAGRAARQFLFEVGPADPWTLGASAAVLASAAVAASWWPARRAARVDPAVVLRCE